MRFRFPVLALWFGAASLSASCTTQLGIVSTDEAFATPIEGRRIVLQGKRTRIEAVVPPLAPPTLWYTLDPSRNHPGTAIGPTAGFTLSFLVENDSARAWTIHRSNFDLAIVGEKTAEESEALVPVKDTSSFDNGDSSVLLTLPPGGAASLRVHFAITAPVDAGALAPDVPGDAKPGPWSISGSELFGRIYRLRVQDPGGALLMQRHLELGEWSQLWQGTRTALLATLVFLLWGALG